MPRKRCYKKYMSLIFRVDASYMKRGWTFSVGGLGKAAACDSRTKPNENPAP
nr:hypothetical protein Q903MT_gene184 [Picea sitchensis]